MGAFHETRVGGIVDVEASHAVETDDKIGLINGNLRADGVYELLMALVIEKAGIGQEFDLDLGFRQIAVPLPGVNLDLMAASDAIAGDPQHIALHPAVGEVLEDDERKSQLMPQLTGKLRIVCENTPKSPQKPRDTVLMPRLLIVKTSSLGDVVHNLPAITDIRTLRPDWTIDWAVEDSFADIPRMHPGIAEVIPVSLRRWRRGLLTAQTWKEIAACKRHLRDRHYDLVLDTQGLLKSVMIASWAKGPRHGYGWGSGREPLPSLFYQHRHEVLWEQPAVVRIRKLAALTLGYELPQTPPDYGIAAPDYTIKGLPQRYVIGLHGTSRDSKLWSEAHWISLGNLLAQQGLNLLLPWGNDEEHARARRIATAVPQAEVLPRLHLPELAGILGKAAVAVGVDTGLIHLAAALDVPTIAIYTDTDPALTGVLGGDPARFANLGGIGLQPAPELVHKALNRLIISAS